MKTKNLLLLLVATSSLGLSSCGHTHEYQTEFVKDETNHWHECTCGEKSEITEHNFNIPGEITLAQTHTEDGTQIYSCECGATTTVTIPQDGHSHSETWSNDETTHWHECTCGDKNCFEALASTKALVSLTKQAMQNNPESKMWSKYNLSNVDGRTVFEFLKTDKTAKEVFNTYITNLGNGIVSLHNIFCPEAIIIGGAISNQKDIILPPLTKYVNNHIYVKNIDYKANIIPAELRGEAGILGAKCLFSERSE